MVDTKHRTRRFPLRYLLLTARWDLLILPAALWALCAIIIAILGKNSNSYNTAVGFLGGLLPLMGGILAAYVVLDDPALELYFSSPAPAWRTLLERVGLILLTLAVAAVSFQVILPLLGIDLAPLGNPLVRQIAWIAPTLSMTGLGIAAGLLLAQGTFGAMLVGMVWIIQVFLRGWFNTHEIARWFALFLGILRPEDSFLRINQVSLVGLAGFFFVIAWWLDTKTGAVYLMKVGIASQRSLAMTVRLLKKNY